MERFDGISLAQLRSRASEKWRTYPPDVLPAFVAEMDFELAEPLRRALHDAVDRNDAGYAAPHDLPPAFAAFAAQRYSWQVDPAQVFAVPDVMSGVAQAIRLLTAPGDAVVINPPVYPPFFEVIPYAGRRVVEVPLLHDAAQERWSLDLDALERTFAGGAQAYLLCTPHNPVGRVWSAADLRAVGALAERYGVALICDEIFAPLVMPDVAYTPVLKAIPNVRRCVALTSASKGWNIAGLKCAVLTASADIVYAMRAYLRTIPTEIVSRVGHLGVIASIAAFSEGVSWLDELVAYLDGNRRLLGDLLHQQLPQLRYEPPQATYLAWIDCREFALESPAQHFLERAGVALEAGARFGRGGESYIRLNMGTTRAILHEIVSRMALAVPG